VRLPLALLLLVVDQVRLELPPRAREAPELEIGGLEVRAVPLALQRRYLLDPPPQLVASRRGDVVGPFRAAGATDLSNCLATL
jgi:hypothetical protein